MKVAVLNTSVPFLRGGAEHLADSLVRELLRRGHEVEHVKIPLRWSSPEAIAESMFAAASMRLPEADRVIALKFPAYLVPHRSKVVWLLHQFRQVYELWGTPYQDLPDTPESNALRRAIMDADNRAFGEAKAIWCNSSVTAGRLKRFNDIDAPVLLAPHGDGASFRTGPYGDFVLAIGRITGSKRQYLLLQALAEAAPGTKLVIAGAPEVAGDLDRLNAEIEQHDLSSRVELVARFISDDEKVELLSTARAVAYLPVDEDSYGYVTAEAMMSGRPVITTTDAGGILELVADGVTGLVAEPTPTGLARAMDRLCGDLEFAERLGVAAAKRVAELDLSWDHTIERLLA